MKDETKQFIENHYGKIYVLGLIVIFAAIIVLGIWGFLGPTEAPVKSTTNRQTINSSR